MAQTFFQHRTLNCVKKCASRGNNRGFMPSSFIVKNKKTGSRTKAYKRHVLNVNFIYTLKCKWWGYSIKLLLLFKTFCSICCSGAWFLTQPQQRCELSDSLRCRCREAEGSRSRRLSVAVLQVLLSLVEADQAPAPVEGRQSLAGTGVWHVWYASPPVFCGKFLPPRELRELRAGANSRRNASGCLVFLSRPLGMMHRGRACVHSQAPLILL